jgi:hypothetical protein
MVMRRIVGIIVSGPVVPCVPLDLVVLARADARRCHCWSL